VMNKQREVLYRKRREILLLDPNKDSFLHEETEEKLSDEEKKEFRVRTAKVPLPVLFNTEKRVFLSIIDQLWVEHLNTMDQLRDAIGLRGYGQVDPLIAYKEESFSLFKRLLSSIDDEAIDILVKIDFEMQAPVKSTPTSSQPLEYQGAKEEDSAEVIKDIANEEETAVTVKSETAVAKEQKPSSGDVITSVRTVGERMQSAVNMSQSSAPSGQKVGRNDPCPCGAKDSSGKTIKYKKCHGR